MVSCQDYRFQTNQQLRAGDTLSRMALSHGVVGRAGHLAAALAAMTAAHARFRRLPGAMRVLAVELCHYADTLITCAAAAVPAVARDAAPAAEPVQPSQADVAGQVLETEPAIAAANGGVETQERSAAGGMSGEDGETRAAARVSGEQRDSAAGNAEQFSAANAAASESSPAAAVAAAPQQSVTAPKQASAAAPTVASLYGSVVAFVLEVLTDAQEGAKANETAAPLQLHLRCLQIAHWQGMVVAAAGGPAGAAQPLQRSESASLPPDGIRSLLAPDSSFARLRCDRLCNPRCHSNHAYQQVKCRASGRVDQQGTMCMLAIQKD